MKPGGTQVRWSLYLWPSLAVFLAAIAITQAVFLQASLHQDLEFGAVAPALTLQNYMQIFSDPLYLRSIWLTIQLSLLAVLIALVVGLPTAYLLSRMNPRSASLIIAAIVAASFVTIVVKALGLNIIFGADGPLNRTWLAMVPSAAPLAIGNQARVLIGFSQYTLGFFVLLLFGVMQAIPRSLEDAAQIHGASRARILLTVILPLSLPGVLNGSLIVFNLCMGAFTAAALLGAGRVLTMPVLIYQTLMVETRYGMAGALSAVLLLLTLLVNLLATAMSQTRQRQKELLF